MEQFLDIVQPIAELATIIVSLVGMLYALKHVRFFDYSEKVTSRRVRKVFLTDAGVYLVTLLMGIGLFFDFDLLVRYDVVVRPFMLLANVVASVRLYTHFKRS